MDRLVKRVGTWVWRYGPAELVGTTAAILAAGLAYEISASFVAAALAANWAEFFAYYALIFWRTLPRDGRPGLRAALVTLRNMVIEFGPAELISVVLRPMVLYAAMALIPSLALGTVIGKIVADICFYVPAVIAYELRLRLLPDTPPAPAAAKRSVHGVTRSLEATAD